MSRHRETTTVNDYQLSYRKANAAYNEPSFTSIVAAIISAGNSRNADEYTDAPDERILEAIAGIVLRCFGSTYGDISVRSLKSRIRTVPVATVRIHFCAAARLHLTSTAIGKWLGRNHATVLSAARTSADLRDAYFEDRRVYSKVLIELRCLNLPNRAYPSRK